MWSVLYATILVLALLLFGETTLHLAYLWSSLLMGATVLIGYGVMWRWAAANFASVTDADVATAPPPYLVWSTSPDLPQLELDQPDPTAALPEYAGVILHARSNGSTRRPSRLRSRAS